MNNNKHNSRVVAAAPGRLEAFSPAMEVRPEGALRMDDVERLKKPLPATVWQDDVETVPAQTSLQAVIIKMVRYRLNVGIKHQVSVDALKKVLIEESGVDKNNIKIITLQNDYTLVELPDEMPQDIFLHLKTVEINHHKLDIKRVKIRNKKRGSNYNRRGRSRTPRADKGGANQVGG